MYASANGRRLADLTAIEPNADFEGGHAYDLSIAAPQHMCLMMCSFSLCDVTCAQCSFISQPACDLQTARLAAG